MRTGGKRERERRKRSVGAGAFTGNCNVGTRLDPDRVIRAISIAAHLGGKEGGGGGGRRLRRGAAESVGEKNDRVVRPGPMRKCDGVTRARAPTQFAERFVPAELSPGLNRAVGRTCARTEAGSGSGKA